MQGGVAVLISRYIFAALLSSLHARIQRVGGPDPPPPPEKSQNIGLLSNAGLDPLKITKPSSQHSLLGHHRLASETFPWRADDGLSIVVFGSSLPAIN